ncbi:MAG: matrixin family metalloprotease [Parcubacteria group bacterium]|nr:matrixin family metalloprotease [Parcubacteria group bacterium]
MKKKFFYGAFSLILIGASAYFIYQNISINPCKKALKYSIGRFDKEFGISEVEFKSYIAKAEQVWEEVLARDIFIYEPDADFKINLIYDERQLETIQKQKTEFGLSVIEDSFKKLDTQFNLFKNNYEVKVENYENALADFQDRKSTYETKVLEWNSRGGAPKNIFESLEAERIYLNSEASRLNAEVSSINTMTRQLNTLLEERNKKASEYNRVAKSYNEKYGEGLEFNQAEYNSGGQINVYQFNTKTDLILALAHEFGHALGMDHVENPNSVMYYLTDTNTETAIVLTPEDLAELKRVCGIK